MALRIDKFSGEIPKIIGRLLPENAAQIAQNTRLEDGSLLPFRCGKLVHSFGSPMQTIYRHNSTWYGWAGVVKVAPAPIAEDRLYLTGDGVPKLITGGVTYPMAVPGPGAAPVTFPPAGPIDPALSSTYVYAYTWVTSLGEESEPSPISNEVVWSPGHTITVGGVSAAPAGRLFVTTRIYRSQTSALGETTMYLVAERASSDATAFLDDVVSHPILEPLPSLSYNKPPDGLQGITALPNGMMAGFVGKRLYFSEPYIPHAWPEKYVLTTDFEIVGLGVFGQSVAVVTKGHPYVVSGVSPDSMAMERLRVNLACTSARGIVDLGSAVVYPSEHGLVAISSGGAEVMTGSLIDREKWRLLGPTTMIGAHNNGRYVGTYALDSHTGMIIIDTTGAQPFLIRASDTAQAMFNEPGTGKLFILAGSGVFEWDSPESPYAEQIWRSKLNVLPGHANFGALLVEGVDTMTDEERAANRVRWDKDALAADISVQGTPPLWLEPVAAGILNPTTPPQAGFCAVVYADGAPVHVVTTLNRPERLPSGFLALSWEIEVHGTMQVTAISLGASPSDLAQLG